MGRRYYQCGSRGDGILKMWSLKEGMVNDCGSPVGGWLGSGVLSRGRLTIVPWNAVSRLVNECMTFVDSGGSAWEAGVG